MMATDRSLATLLRALQDTSNEQDLPRLLGSAATLLTLLSNPLNVTLLSAQLLSAPAIWSKPEGLRITVQVIGIFSSATTQIIQREHSSAGYKFSSSQSRLSKEDWIKAVIRGADERSPRWRHILALGGLLLGSEGKDSQTTSDALRRTLESATIKALNLALEEIEAGSELAVNSLVVTLSHIFNLLSDSAKYDINHDLLLPYLCWSPFFSSEGLHFGYFLSTMDTDIIECASMKFDWSTKSSTYFQVQHIASSPLVASLGSFSRLMTYSIEYVQNVELLTTMISEISAFTRSLCVQWRQNKLSEIDVHEESIYLSDESLQISLPLLWQVLKSSMFTIIIALRSLLGRVLGDTKLAVESGKAPFMATQTLQILRSIFFISSRSGANAFSQYTFVYLTAIDVLSQYPVQVEAFLQEIRPAEISTIGQHPLDRCHDLYFLNTAEHFPLVLSPEANERLLISVAMPYLGVGSDQRLIEIFEAAHSVVLAVFSAPQNSGLVAKHLHSYVNALFQVFPYNLSPRQFRIAVKTLVCNSSPPSLLSASQPMLTSTLLELVRMRAEKASTRPLPPPSATESEHIKSGEFDLSEQAVMVLTLIDSLLFLSLSILEEWLLITAETLNLITDEAMKNTCLQRFWEVLSSGEMDVNRAAICVSWWSTNGGRDIVLNGTEKADAHFMSGGLGERSKL